MSLLFASRASYRGIDSDDPVRGLLVATISLFARLAFATLVLFVYKRFVPDGYPWFGITLAGAFVVTYSVELVRYAGLGRYARPATGSRDGR